MADLIKVLILGIVEGVTEFLPISSTGHLIVAAALLDFGRGMGGVFVIFIQVGAVVAVVLYYRRDLWYQVTHVRTDRGVQRFWLAIIIAFIPAAVVGLLFGDWIQANLLSPLVVAITLIIGGVIFLLVELRPAGQQAKQTAELTAITPVQALVVGVAQVLALIPGTSRAGASIVGGLIVGMDRPTATRFSFYLAIPTLGGATVYDLWKHRDLLQAGDLFYLFVGAVVSGIVAWLAIRWLINYVSRNNFNLFGVYRILAGAAIIVLIALQVLQMGV